jgi:hypothetical protein
MGTMAPIRPTGQRLHRISLTAGRPLGGLLLEVLEVLEVACRPGGVRLAAGVPGGGVAGEGEAEDEQRSRCADSSPRLLERRPTAVPGWPAYWRRRRCQPDVSAKVGEMAPTRREGHDESLRIRASTRQDPHPARREGINMRGFIKRAAVAPGYGPVAADVR